MSEETANASDEPQQAKTPESATREVIKSGNGRDFPQPGDIVKMNYVGTLSDGTVFDSSRERGKPFRTLIGCGKVIKAWDCLVLKMSVGEEAKFICPPETAYGTSGFPGKIPPNSTLTFLVELLEIEKEPEPAQPPPTWNQIFAQLIGPAPAPAPQ